MKHFGILFFLLIPILGLAQNFVNINGLNMYYEIHGEGEPLLILHGGAGSMEDMKSLINFFSDRYMVIANDRQGHGKTLDLDGDLSYERMTENTVDLLDYLKQDRVNVIGFSDGGIIALTLAIKYPERLKKAVYIGTNYHHDGIPESEKDWIRTSELNDKIKKLWLTSPTFSEEELNRIKCPSLIVIGDRDGLYLEHTISLFRNVKNSELSIIPNATHNLLNEKPELVNYIVSHFLQ